MSAATSSLPVSPVSAADPAPVAPGPVLEARGITRSFGSHQALRGVDLELHPGQVVGLLGPNGAGKTTMVRILTTLLRPDGGSATVAGHDLLRHPGRVRSSIGLSGQYAAVDAKLTAAENLRLVGLLYGFTRKQARARADELLERFSLADVGSRRAGTFSGGMRRRLDLAGALVASPPVVVLDEPTTGLDPRARLETWDVVGELVRDGTAVLLTTQYLEEADQLADTISVIDAGRVIARGTSDELKQQVGGHRVEVLVDPGVTEPARRALAGLAEAGAVEVAADGRRLSVPAPDGDASLHAVLTALRGAEVRAVEAALRRPTLDDVFLTITGHGAGEEVG